MIPVPPFNEMSTVQANVTYSSLIVYECPIIALLHLYSWRHDEAWYNYSDQPRQASTSPRKEFGAEAAAADGLWRQGMPASVLGRRGGGGEEGNAFRNNR